MSDDPVNVVIAGYDAIADTYFAKFEVSAVREKWLKRLLAGVPQGSRILDLGCGAGIPVAKTLAAYGHSVVGVDGSSEQIARASRNVHSGTFVAADMCTVEFDENSFDGICAFYSMTHVPPKQQPILIDNIGRWLKPGGTFVASFGVGPAHEWTGPWLGTKMYFGHCGEEEALNYLSNAGFAVRNCCVDQQDNEEVSFMWVEATRR